MQYYANLVWLRTQDFEKTHLMGCMLKITEDNKLANDIEKPHKLVPKVSSPTIWRA